MNWLSVPILMMWLIVRVVVGLVVSNLMVVVSVWILLVGWDLNIVNW